MNESDVAVRPVAAHQRAEWQALWTDYLTFYGASVPPATYDVTWSRLQDPAEPMFVLGASVAGKLCGIAHFIYHRSCWNVEGSCYLQDLFVAKANRNQGLGGLLIEAVCRGAKDHGVRQVHWLTHETNATAQALYNKLAERPGFIEYIKPV